VLGTKNLVSNYVMVNYSVYVECTVMWLVEVLMLHTYIHSMEGELGSDIFLDTVLIHITLSKRNHIQQNILLALHQI